MTRRRMTREDLRAREVGRPLDVEHVRVLRLLSYGLRLRQVAATLDAPMDTIKFRCRVLYARLDAVNAAHAVRIAFETGVLGATTEVVDRPDVVVAEDDLEDEVDP